MPRPRRRNAENSPLARHLKQTLAVHRLTIREAAKIAGCAPSVFGGWLTGAFPGAETINSLAKFCRHYKISLELILTGQQEAQNSGPLVPPARAVVELKATGLNQSAEPFFEGIAHVRILRVDDETVRI